MHKVLLGAAMMAVITACQAQSPNVGSAAQETHMKDGLITKQSAHSAAVTIDRLEAAAKAKGLNVFARVNHQQNAAKMDLEMPASILLIFGSPKIGSPLMNASPTIGIDLPVKALAYEKDGNVYLSYNDPAYLSTRHNVGEAGQNALGKMSGALAGLSDHAVAE